MDLRVGDAEAGTVRRLTTDGVEKGRPCFDPSGTRVAFFVGVGAGRPWGATTRPGRNVHLRVVWLEDGHAWDSPLAPAPDGGAPLGDLQWASGRAAVVYGYGGVDGAMYLQAVPQR